MTRKIAIIGAGPAGYTLAQELVKAENEYQIDIFDKEAEIGGAIYTGIPEYRMPKTFLEKAYNGLVEAGVKFHFNTFVDQAMFKELQSDYDYVVVAIGAQIENTFGFETGNGVVAGLTLLYDLNINHKQADFKKYKKAAYDAYKKYIQIVGKPDIILVQSILPGGIAAKYIKEKEGIPYIVHAHSEAILTNPIYQKYVNEIVKYADDYMAVNNNIKEKIEAIRKKECHIIPNFIDCKKFDLSKEKKTDDFKLVSICNFYKVKSLDVLLKALNIVVNEKNKKNVKLKIVGTGEYKDFYESICHSLKLNDNVEFMGYVNNDEIPNILCNSDVLCVSSSFETFCIPIVEAFASGIPVITTNCTGPLEIVDKSNSVVVPINDINLFADAIIDVMNNYKKYNSKEIKKYAYDKYDKSTISKKIIKICEDVINKKKSIK